MKKLLLFLLFLPVLVQAAPGPPIKQQALTTNTVTGTFANGEVVTWDNTAKAWTNSLPGTAITNTIVNVVLAITNFNTAHGFYLDWRYGNDATAKPDDPRFPWLTPSNCVEAQWTYLKNGTNNLIMYGRPGIYNVDHFTSVGVDGVAANGVLHFNPTNVTWLLDGVIFQNTKTNECMTLITTNADQFKIVGLTFSSTRQSGATNDRSGILQGAWAWAGHMKGVELDRVTFTNYTRHCMTPKAGTTSGGMSIHHCLFDTYGATNTADFGGLDGQAIPLLANITVDSCVFRNGTRGLETEGFLNTNQHSFAASVTRCVFQNISESSIIIIPDFNPQNYFSILIKDNYFDGSGQEFPYAIICRGGYRNRFVNNYITDYYTGILLEADGTFNVLPQVIGNTIYNTDRPIVAVDNQDEADFITEAEISDNMIHGGSEFGMFLELNDSLIHHNTITDVSNKGIWLAGNATVNDPCQGNTLSENQIYNTDGTGLYIEASVLNTRLRMNVIRDSSVINYNKNGATNVSEIWHEIAGFGINTNAPTEALQVHGKVKLPLIATNRVLITSSTNTVIGGAIGSGLSFDGTTLSATNAGGTNVSVGLTTSTLNSNIVVGNTSISISTAFQTGLNNKGLILQVDPYLDHCESFPVTSVSSTLFTVTRAARRAHTNGAVVRIISDGRIDLASYNIKADGSTDNAMKLQVAGIESQECGAWLVNGIDLGDRLIALKEPWFSAELKLRDIRLVAPIDFSSTANMQGVTNTWAILKTARNPEPFTGYANSNAIVYATPAGFAVGKTIAFNAPYGETLPGGITSGRLYLIKTVAEGVSTNNWMTISEIATPSTELNITTDGTGWLHCNHESGTRIKWENVRLSLNGTNLNGAYWCLQQQAYTEKFRLDMEYPGTNNIGVQVVGQGSYHNYMEIDPYSGGISNPDNTNQIAMIVGGSTTAGGVYHHFTFTTINGNGGVGIRVYGSSHQFEETLFESLRHAGFQLMPSASAIHLGNIRWASITGTNVPCISDLSTATDTYSVGQIRTTGTDVLLVRDTTRGYTIRNWDGSVLTGGGDGDQNEVYPGHYQTYGSFAPWLNGRRMQLNNDNRKLRHIDKGMIVNTSGGSFTNSLPDAAGWLGLDITIIKQFAANSAVVLPYTGQTINGDSSYTLTKLTETATFISDGVSNWLVDTNAPAGGSAAAAGDSGQFLINSNGVIGATPFLTYDNSSRLITFDGTLGDAYWSGNSLFGAAGSHFGLGADGVVKLTIYTDNYLSPSSSNVFSIGGASEIYMYSNVTAGSLSAIGNFSNTVPMTVQGPRTVTQQVNLTEWRSNGGTNLLANVASNGVFVTPKLLLNGGGANDFITMGSANTMELNVNDGGAIARLVNADGFYSYNPALHFGSGLETHLTSVSGGGMKLGSADGVGHVGFLTTSNVFLTSQLYATNGVATYTSNLLATTVISVSDGVTTHWTNTLGRNVQVAWSGGTAVSVGVNANQWPTNGYVILQPSEIISFTNTAGPFVKWKPF